MPILDDQQRPCISNSCKDARCNKGHLHQAFSLHLSGLSSLEVLLPDSETQEAFPETLVPNNSFPSLSTHQHLCLPPISWTHCIFSYEPSTLHRGIKRPAIAWLVYPKVLRNSFRQGDKPAVHEKNVLTSLCEMECPRSYSSCKLKQLFNNDLNECFVLHK